MRRDLDLTLLRAFLAVVESGSVTGAARVLNRTQAAVSLQIKRLEDMLGQPLFERGHKRVSLTNFGEQMIGHAQRLVATNDAILEAMTTPSFEGEVRLGLPVDLIPTYAPPILRRFNARWPGVRVSLVTSNSQALVEDLLNGRTDLAVTTDLETGEPGVETLALDQLVWIGSPTGTAHLRKPLPVSLGGRNCRFRPVALDVLRKAGIPWRVVMEVSNQDAVNATVSAGISVSILLRETVPHELAILGEAEELPPLPTFALNLRMPPGGGSDMVQDMAMQVRAEFAGRWAAQIRAPASRRMGLERALQAS